MTAPDLNFTIETAEALQFAASPHIAFKLRVSAGSAQSIHAVILKCQIHLETGRRRYSAAEQQRLADLFGEPNRWDQTLRSMLWTNTSVIVPAFVGSAVTDLHAPCTFDFNAAATKYFAGVDDGEIPVAFYFNGTFFYEGELGHVQAAHVSWEKETSYRMRVRLWRELMDAYYPNTAWLCLEREAFEQLYAYKIKHGIPTFEKALTRAMESANR